MNYRKILSMLVLASMLLGFSVNANAADPYLEVKVGSSWKKVYCNRAGFRPRYSNSKLANAKWKLLNSRLLEFTRTGHDTLYLDCPEALNSSDKDDLVSSNICKCRKSSTEYIHGGVIGQSGAHPTLSIGNNNSDKGLLYPNSGKQTCLYGVSNQIRVARTTEHYNPGVNSKCDKFRLNP